MIIVRPIREENAPDFREMLDSDDVLLLALVLKMTNQSPSQRRDRH
jgi:hypothetical protein